MAFVKPEMEIKTMSVRDEALRRAELVDTLRAKASPEVFYSEFGLNACLAANSIRLLVAQLDEAQSKLGSYREVVAAADRALQSGPVLGARGVLAASTQFDSTDHQADDAR